MLYFFSGLNKHNNVTLVVTNLFLIIFSRCICNTIFIGENTTNKLLFFHATMQIFFFAGLYLLCTLQLRLEYKHNVFYVSTGT